MSKAKPWEIWWAYVVFEDDESQGKERPVLVLEDNTVYVLSLMITSHAGRDVYGEHEIVKWQSTGLSKPSTIRITRRLELSEDDLIRKIGDLQAIDIVLLSKLL